MTPANSSVQKNYPRPLDVQLPDADVRTRFNERAFRNWTESSRRVDHHAVEMAVQRSCQVRVRDLSRCSNRALTTGQSPARTVPSMLTTLKINIKDPDRRR